MTYKEFNKIIENILTKLNLKKEYKILCKEFNDSDNRKNIIKKEAIKLKKEFLPDFEIAGSEKMFFKDYYFGDVQLRFMIPYGGGTIDCSYRVFKGTVDNTIPSFSYRRISESNKRYENDHISTFPIITNIEEYKTALKLILKIDKYFVQLFANELSNNEN